MKEIIKNVYLGCDADVEEFKDLHPDGVIIHAAKEKWHREAVGYTGRGAPKDHPEYLVAIRDNELMLNLVDSPKPEFIPRQCFDAAAAFFSDKSYDLPVLIHCNQGKSRAPGVLLYCLFMTDELNDLADDGLLDFERIVYWLEEEIGYECEFGDGVYLALTEWIDG